MAETAAPEDVTAYIEERKDQDESAETGEPIKRASRYEARGQPTSKAEGGEMIREEAITYLERKGWSEAAAGGIVAHLGLASTSDMVPAKRWGLYCDWCSASERNPDYATSALAFIDYELRNSFATLGRDLEQAGENAINVVAPYWGRGAVRFLTLDPGNPELANA